jgi:hypothetical protein
VEARGVGGSFGDGQECVDELLVRHELRHWREVIGLMDLAFTGLTGFAPDLDDGPHITFFDHDAPDAAMGFSGESVFGDGELHASVRVSKK